MKGFLFLSLIFILQTFPPASASLEETCRLASEANAEVDYNFCITTLQVVPESRTTDARGLAFIAADLARANFTSTKGKIDGILSPTWLGLKLRDGDRAALTNCSTKYADGVSAISSAVDSIKSGNLSGAQKQISGATIGVSQCMASLAEVEMKPIMEEENKNALGLTNILQDFTSFIKH